MNYLYVVIPSIAIIYSLGMLYFSILTAPLDNQLQANNVLGLEDLIREREQ